MQPGWMLPATIPSDATSTLVVFPHAGGDPQTFRSWQKALGSSVHVAVVALPGRGARRAEPSLDEFDAVVEALGTHLGDLRSRPYAFFGHSLGALVAFELARLWSQDGGRRPMHLFASSRPAPQIPASYLREAPTNDELQADIASFGGTPDRLLVDEDMMRIILAPFRADLTALATYRYREAPALTCPLTVLRGREDAALREPDAEAWAYQTRSRFTLHNFEGGHFFWRTQMPLLTEVVTRELARTG